jgi:hypothetical protein
VPSEWISTGDGLPPDQQLYLAIAHGRDDAERMAGARRVAAAAISAAAAKYACGAASNASAAACGASAASAAITVEKVAPWGTAPLSQLPSTVLGIHGDEASSGWGSGSGKPLLYSFTKAHRKGLLHRHGLLFTGASMSFTAEKTRLRQGSFTQLPAPAAPAVSPRERVTPPTAGAQGWRSLAALRSCFGGRVESPNPSDWP